MLGGDLIPVRFLFLDDAAHPLRHELVLRSEMAIQRHLVRPRRLGERFHADPANTDATEQVVGGFEDALAWWRTGRVGHGERRCSDDSRRFGYLTCVLPIGNIANVTDRYRAW